MSIGLVFWILMLLWLILGFALRLGYLGPHIVWGGDIMLFLLLLLLGWKVFGAPVHG